MFSLPLGGSQTLSGDGLEVEECLVGFSEEVQRHLES